MLSVATVTRLSETVEASMAAGASKVTGIGSGITVVGWFTQSSIGMWAGILIGILGLAVNWYFKHQGDKRAQEAHQAYMRKLNASSGAIPLGRHEADE